MHIFPVELRPFSIGEDVGGFDTDPRWGPATERVASCLIAGGHNHTYLPSGANRLTMLSMARRLKSRSRNSRSTRLHSRTPPAFRSSISNGLVHQKQYWLELSQRDLLTISEQVRGQRFAAF